MQFLTSALAFGQTPTRTRWTHPPPVGLGQLRLSPRLSAAVLLTSVLGFSSPASAAQLRGMCVVDAPSRNACERDGSFRFSSAVSFDPNKAPPSWITPRETALFAQTIAEAKAGQLHPFWNYVPSSNRRVWSWTVLQACDGGPDAKIWGDRGCGSVYYSGLLTGYATLGFHPLGAENGTWLTQILGEIVNPDGSPYLRNARCAGTGLFVNVTKINDTQPFDPRFEMRVSQEEFLSTDPRVSGYRTDDDLVANGVVLSCNSERYKPCRDLPGVQLCDPGPPFVHFDCPATGSGLVSVDNCSYNYTAVKRSGSTVEHAGAVGILGLWVALCLLFLL